MIELKASLFVHPDNTNARVLAEVAEELRARSGGRLAIRMYPSEQLAPTRAQYDLACTGAADLVFIMHGTMEGRFPLTEIATLPFVAPDPVSGTEALLALLPTHLAREHVGVKVLFLAANAPMAVHSHMPLGTLADFKGKRIRYPGNNTAATLAALGAEPVSVLPHEVAPALENRSIDGAAMTYQGAGYTKIAPLVKYSTDLNANTITLALVMNPAAYDRLPRGLQTLVDEVLGASAARRVALALARDARLGKEYMRSGGVTIIEPDAEARAAFDAAVQPVIETTLAALEAKGLPAREVYRALKAATRK